MMNQQSELITGNGWENVVKEINFFHEYLKSEDSITNIVISTGSARNALIGLLGAWLSGKTFSISKRSIKGTNHVLLLTDEILENKFLSKKNQTSNFLKDMREVWGEICLNFGESSSQAMIVSTSGSTGTPKSVVFSFKSVIHHINYMIKRFGVTCKTKELIILPVSSTAVLFSQLLPVAISQGTLKKVGTPFNVYEVIQELKTDYDYTGITPTIMRLLLKVEYDWKTMKTRYVAVGGEKIDFDLLTKVNKKIRRNAFYPMYGLTEVLAVFCIGGPNDEKCPYGSVGKPFAEWKIRIEENELQVKSQYLALGYINMQGRLVSLNLTKDGWLRTGDMATMSSAGYLYIYGRIKNVIISGGVNIYPEEIEVVMERMSGVKHVLVEKRNDNLLGEVPIAKVVMTRNSRFDKKSLFDFAKANLENIKIPRSFEQQKTDVNLIGMGKMGRKIYDKN